jgi:hypothetical protein
MEKIDISDYLAPDRRHKSAAERALSAANLARPKRARTYSVVLGYGFRPSLKARDRDPNVAEKQD